MKSKFLKIALTLLTIAVIGQIGMRLWLPQPEAAKAKVLFEVELYYGNPHVGITNVGVWIWITGPESHIYGFEAVHIGNGIYQISESVDAQATSWEIELSAFDLEENGWILIDPDESPVTGLSFNNPSFSRELIADPVR